MEPSAGVNSSTNNSLQVDEALDQSLHENIVFRAARLGLE